MLGQLGQLGVCCDFPIKRSHSRHPEPAAWKVELPAAFRWGLGPVRYRRSAHDEAQTKKRWVAG